MKSAPPLHCSADSVGLKDPFTHAVIGKAMETHSALGPGLVEEFYHRELSARLVAAGLEHESKPRRPLEYRGFVADIFEPDMLFPGRLVPELKALRGGFDPEHFVQIISYLKFYGLQTGMLFDFGKESLLFKRVTFTAVNAAFPDAPLPPFVTDPDLAESMLHLIREIHGAHGVGYRESTYQGLLRATLQAERISFTENPSATIARWGLAQLRCFVVDDRCAVSVTALGDDVSAADRAALQTCLHWLDLPWGLAVHFGRRSVHLRFVVRPKQSPTDSERPPI